MDIDIRSERLSDRKAIHVVTQAAFRNVRHSENTEQFIVRALRNAGALSVSLVAEVEGEVVGHVAASPVTISDGSPGWHGIGPVSVRPDCQGRGIGSQLMRRALDELRSSEAKGCVVLGEPAYYGRFGFRHEPQLEFQDAPAEYFQAIMFGPALPRGVVTYHEAFRARG